MAYTANLLGFAVCDFFKLYNAVIGKFSALKTNVLRVSNMLHSFPLSQYILSGKADILSASLSKHFVFSTQGV